MSDSLISEEPLMRAPELNEAEDTALLPTQATFQPALFPTRSHNQTEGTPLFPLPSKLAPSRSHNQTEGTPLMPLPSAQPPSRSHNHTEGTPLFPLPSALAPSRSHNQTEGIALLPLPLTPISGTPSAAKSSSDGQAVSRLLRAGAGGEDLDGPSSIRIEDEALRKAIRSWDVASVKWQLATGAPLDHVADATTPLHMCVEKYWFRESEDYMRPEKYQRKKTEIMEAMVEAAKKSGVLDCPDGEGHTPLYVAIESGNLESVKALVGAGADIINLNRIGETPLHVAVRSEHPKILQYFLDNHEIPNSVNKYGFAPMHFAAISGVLESATLLLEKFKDDQLYLRKYDGSTVWHEIASWNAMAIAQYLFQTKYSWNLNLVDNKGKTPLHRAALEGNVPMTTLLMRNGASLSVQGEKESVIKYIASEFDNPLTFFEDLFDECVKEKNEYYKVNYKVLVSDKNVSQINVLEDLVRYGQSKILKHPTIESLIYFKWRCLLPVFYTIIVTYVTFLVTLNGFVIASFYNIDKSKVTCNTTEKLLNSTELPFNATNMLFNSTELSYNATELPFNATEIPLNASEGQYNVTGPCLESTGCWWWHWTLVLLIYISTGVLIFQEGMWIYLQKFHYYGRAEAWLKLGLLLLALGVPVFLDCSAAPDSMTWQRHLACVAVILSWLQAMLLMSRFHGWGYYVLMLERVAVNILKILATTIFLVFGFSTCFMIQYQSKPPFDGPVAAFIKTLVMMASEFDYEDLFGEDHDEELKNTIEFVRFLFVVFVIFIAVVLMNFLVGVAVSDVNELNEIGNIRRLEKQVQLLSTLEGLGDTVLAKWWRRLLLIRFHSHAGRSATSPVRMWAVDDLYDPEKRNHNDYFREYFSSELHNALLNIAKKKKQNVDKLDAVYDAVVGMPQQKCDNVSIASSSPTTTLNDRIKSLEEKMDKMLECMASNVNSKDKAKVVSHRLLHKRKVFKKKNNH